MRASGTELSGGPHTSCGLGPFQAFDIQDDGDIEGKDSVESVQELSEFEIEALLGNHFWAKGYFVNTVGLDEQMIKNMSSIKKSKNVG